MLKKKKKQKKKMAGLEVLLKRGNINLTDMGSR